MPRTWVGISLVPVFQWCEKMLWWVTGKGSIPVAVESQAGKGGSRESWLHAKLDRHLFSKQLLLIFLASGLSSSEVRVRQGKAGLFFSDR